jgi:nucleoside-diphosphate-sugar epimerase
MPRSLELRRLSRMTEIVITGPTGVIGRRAVRELLAAGGVAPDETGTASGLLNSSRQIGAALGLAAPPAGRRHLGPLPCPRRRRAAR